ncbi:MAG: hypothetical protein ACM3ML_31625 [Micromonosporaceae bacterium]
MADQPRHPGGGEQRGAPERRTPRAIRNAVTLMYVGAAVSIVSLIIGLATAGGLKSAIRKAQPHLTTAQVNNTATSIIAATVITGLLGAGLWLWMAWANKRGRSWARILSSVFFGIATLDSATAVTRPGDLFGKIITVAIWVVGVGAIVGLWLPESNAYYRAVGERVRA